MSLTTADLSYMRAEQELLLCCSRTTLNDNVIKRAEEILAKPLDWEFQFSFGRTHGLLPLFYHQLRTIAADAIPNRELIKLKRHCQENAARNVVLTEELTRLLQSLEGAGVEAVPYKGPALAEFAYGNVSYRRFLDLDILVRRADVSRAVQVLHDSDYYAASQWSKAQQEILLRTQHNLQFNRHDKKLLVELHWEVASELFARSLQAEAFWSRLVPMTLNNVPIKTLATEDLLLSLCVHGSKHLWERLSWVCDVAELLRSHQIDWDVLFERSGQGEQDRMLGLGLSLAHQLFDAPLSDTVKERLTKDKSIGMLLTDTCKRVFERNERDHVSVNENLSFNFRVRETWRSRLRYVRMVLQPTDADVGIVSLPQLLGFGYYLIRPFRFLRPRGGR
jgi:putative nucleotidyltransferase-like protein